MTAQGVDAFNWRVPGEMNNVRPTQKSENLSQTIQQRISPTVTFVLVAGTQERLSNTYRNCSRFARVGKN